MYQFIYPWVTPDMFTLLLPKGAHADVNSTDYQVCIDIDFQTAGDNKVKDLYHATKNTKTTKIKANHAAHDDCDMQIFKAAEKFIAFIDKRDTEVTYHGPDTCNDKKPWAIYAHFHVTVVSGTRLGQDTMYNNVVAMHRKVATCHIPASQITKFPASWANYLAKTPRITWHVGTEPIIDQFGKWTMEGHIAPIERQTVSRKRIFADALGTQKENFDPDNPEQAMLHMRNGKCQKLYDYLSWQIKEHDYATREDLVDGALSHGTGDNFSRALIHPHFDVLLNKAFTMDKATEINMPFARLFEKMDWSKFNTKEYLAKDVSLRLFSAILKNEGICESVFVKDIHELLTLKNPKQNLIFFEGVPNSGKSFIARSIASIFKYQSTIQGTTSFPFMELAQSSIGLIEEPVFSADALQTLKKLAEGTATDVAVKNRKAARIPRIPLLITANYDFIVQGGSTEKEAFASRMKKYVFKAASGFLKLATMGTAVHYPV